MWPWYIGLDSKSGLSCKYISPPRRQQFPPGCISSLKTSFEEILLQEISFILALFYPFCSIFFSHLNHHKTICLFLLPPPSPSPSYHTLTISLHSHWSLFHFLFSPPPTLSPVFPYTVHSYPYFEQHPRDVAVQSDRELAIHSCFLLQRLWLSPFFSFHLLQLLFLTERPLWLNFLISRPAE